jgi:type I restriction enzyme S subunit
MRKSKIAKSELQIPLPTIKKQTDISKALEKAYKIRKKREESLQLTDEFIRSLFLYMFEDTEDEFSIWSLENEIKLSIHKEG